MSWQSSRRLVPRWLPRVLPMVSSLGVGRIYVSGAARCPKDYFSSHLLRDDDVSRANLRAALVEGLAQSGDTAVPRVEVHRSLWRLLKQLGPPEDTPGVRRLLCHPRRADDPDGAVDARFDRTAANAQRGSKTVHEGLEWHALADVRSDAWRRERMHFPGQHRAAGAMRAPLAPSPSTASTARCIWCTAPTARAACGSSS